MFLTFVAHACLTLLVDSNIYCLNLMLFISYTFAVHFTLNSESALNGRGNNFFRFPWGFLSKLPSLKATGTEIKPDHFFVSTVD